MKLCAMIERSVGMLGNRVTEQHNRTMVITVLKCRAKVLCLGSSEIFRFENDVSNVNVNVEQNAFAGSKARLNLNANTVIFYKIHNIWCDDEPMSKMETESEEPYL